MRTKYIPCILFFIILFPTCLIFAGGGAKISITGQVKQAMHLSLNDLESFQTVSVQLNDVMKDKSYRGAFYYQGVPVRTLLDTAVIEKKVKDFSKDIDLAIKVTNSEGSSVVLSWGEIYYRNSQDIIIATSATPIRPHKSCASCHDDESICKPYLDVFNRNIEFPKLVVGPDGYGERSIEDVVTIEVIDPDRNRDITGNSSAALSSLSFTIAGLVKKDITMTDLSRYPRKELTMIHMGEGKGFHGIAEYSGPTLKTLLEEAGIDHDLTTAFLVSAPDGYRSLFSYGEVFLKRGDDSIIMADMIDNMVIDDGGRFFLVPCEDIMSDRDVKSVERIEVISLKITPAR